LFGVGMFAPPGSAIIAYPHRRLPNPQSRAGLEQVQLQRQG
jgi:hypothetical protein